MIPLPTVSGSQSFTWNDVGAVAFEEKLAFERVY
jgi:hypothetical protein